MELLIVGSLEEKSVKKEPVVGHPRWRFHHHGQGY